jgi:cell division GTPase FtsZ
MASILKDIINEIKIDEKTDLFDKKINVNAKTNELLSNLDDETDSLGNFRVKVFGVGGAGCNVIDHMISARV